MIIPVNYAQVNHMFTGTAAPRGAQITYGVANPGSAMTAAEIAEAASLAWSTTGLTLAVTSLTLASTKAKLGPNDTGPEAVFTDGSFGIRSQPGVTPQVSLLGIKNTALGGRHMRGRMFIPGAAEEDVDESGIVSGAAVGSWNTAFNDFLTALQTAGIEMRLLHTDSTVPTPVTSIVLSNLASTQRRRLRKVGGRRRTP